MSTFHPRSNLADVVAQDDSRAIIQEVAPEVLVSPLAKGGEPFPLGRVLTIVLDPSDPRIEELLARLGQVEDRTPRPVETAPILPRRDYEGQDVAVASARLVSTTTAKKNRTVELVWDGPTHGNPFVDINFTAVFTREGHSIEAGGFCDGGGRHVIRFLPPHAGVWEYVTRSTARSLDGHTGSVEVSESDAPGPVRADGMHFSYANGQPFVPVGTTAYAWTHQDKALQGETLEALARAPFTKLRMGLFPKHFLYNDNEPERFVFPRADDGWDTTAFDITFFHEFEQNLRELDALGIQADLILFHPYDKWGFSHLGKAADQRYVAYVVRRLAAFPNVWWSLANEYDLLVEKSLSDWDDIARTVQENDPYGHPLSIHNWIDLWDYSSPWATHCSIQHGELLGGKVREWRQRWDKPVVVDEFGYEGDLDQGWGFLTAQEEMARLWAITMGGGYGTHGETYYSDDDVIFWAKGGTLRGESIERIAFLRSVIAESPTGRLEALPSDFDAAHAGVAGEYVLIYFGAGRPAFRTVTVPEGMKARIDVIDTWNMTIDGRPGIHEGQVKIDLPAVPYVALRLVAEEDPR